MLTAVFIDFWQLEGSIPEKYGQFHLILEFIVEPSWNCQMVEKAIQDRTKKARSLCMAYQFICDYLKLSDSGNILQVSHRNTQSTKSWLSCRVYCWWMFWVHQMVCAWRLKMVSNLFILNIKWNWLFWTYLLLVVLGCMHFIICSPNMIKWLMRLLDLFYLRLFCSSYSLHYFCKLSPDR